MFLTLKNRIQFYDLFMRCGEFRAFFRKLKRRGSGKSPSFFRFPCSYCAKMRLAALFPQENARCPYRCVQDKIDCCACDQSTGTAEERHQRGTGQGLGNKKIDGDTCGLAGNGNHGAKKGPDGKGNQIGSAGIGKIGTQRCPAGERFVAQRQDERYGKKGHCYRGCRQPTGGGRVGQDNSGASQNDREEEIAETAHQVCPRKLVETFHVRIHQKSSIISFGEAVKLRTVPSGLMAIMSSIRQPYLPSR